MSDLLITNGRVWSGSGSQFNPGVVEIRDGRVTFVGAPEAHANPNPPAQRLDAQGGLVMPGLVNGHTHGAMTLFRGLADDMALASWLSDHIFPAEAKWVTPEMVELCTLLAAGEMMLSGTTTVCDAYFCVEGAARAYARAGMRAVVAQGVIDFPAPGVPDPGRKMEVCRRFIEDWQGVNPLVRPALFAHSPYTCSPATLRQVSALAKEAGAPWFIHLGETREEVRTLVERHGLTPARHLEELGVLAGLTAAVHGIWLTNEELALLARRGVAVIACTESNMKLGSGVANIPGMLKAGLTVGLGADGPASNNDLSMIGELGMTARLAKLDRMDPTALPAATVLNMATQGSARALGLEALVGRLEPGYAGDVMVLQANAPHLTPLFDPPSALAYQCRGSDVRHLVVEGRVVVKDRQVTTFDLKAVMAEVNKLAKRVKAG